MACQVQTYFRLCHRCSLVTFAQHKVERCAHCSKPFAPFFYFNEQYVTIDTDSEPQAPQMPGEVRPLKGFTALWTEWSDE